MLARLMRNGGVLYFLLALYFAVNAALRVALQGSLEMEESRLFFLSQWLVPGYGGQAPLAIWMQHGAVLALGANALAVIVLENLLLFLAYAFVGLAAFQVIRNKALAIIAVLGMLLLPQVAYELQRDGGATVAVLMATAFFIATLFIMLHRGSFFAHLLAGLGIGVGLLASYDVALLLVAVLLLILLEPAFRARLLNWRMIVTILVAGVVLAPHALWLRDNVDLMVAENLARIPHHAAADPNSQIIEGLFSLVAALVGFFVPTIIVFWLAFGRRFAESWQASSPWTRLLGRTFVLVLLALIALVVFGKASAIHDRWLVPFFFMVPLYFSLKLEALNQTIGNAPNRFGAIAILVMIAVPLVIAARLPVAGWTHQYSKIEMPYGQVVEDTIGRGEHPPSIIFAEDAELAGNVRLGAKGVPVVTRETAFREKSFVFDETHPLLVVGRSSEGERNGPAQLTRRLSDQFGVDVTEPTVKYGTFYFLYGGEKVAREVGYGALIYPPAPGE